VDDKLTIETPEQIPLEFPLAGLGSRFLALAVDTLIQGAIMLVLAILGVVLFLGLSAYSEKVGLWGIAIYVLISFLIQSGYFAFFEAFWNGQTPGKRYLHIRVIEEAGRPITPYQSVLRNLMRIVDGYGIGVVSILISAKNKRLGDYVAGTVVVHEKALAQQSPEHWGNLQGAEATGYAAGKLSPEEFQLIEAFLLRRGQLAMEVRNNMARQIIKRIGDKLELSPEDRIRAEPLLERLANEYRSQAQYR